MKSMTIDELEKLKKEQKLIRVVGIIMVVVGYAGFLPIALAQNTSDAPNPILAAGFMFIAVAGIVMVVRSFFHVKYKKMKQELQKRQWLMEYEREKKWRQEPAKEKEKIYKDPSNYLIYCYTSDERNQVVHTKLEVQDKGLDYEVIYTDDDSLIGYEENKMTVPKDYFMNFSLIEIANLFNNMSYNKNLNLTPEKLQNNKEFNRLTKGPYIIRFSQSIHCLIKERNKHY